MDGWVRAEPPAPRCWGSGLKWPPPGLEKTSVVTPGFRANLAQKADALGSRQQRCVVPCMKSLERGAFGLEVT